MISDTTPVPHRRIAWQVPIFRRVMLLLGIGLVLGWTGGAQAEKLQSLPAIQQAAIGYLEGQHTNTLRQPQVTAAALDPRLRLAACEAPLEAFTPPGQRTMGATTVGVRCGAPVSWTVYVQATVALIRPVLVARRPLPRGTVLTGADVQVVEQDVSRLTLGYLADLKDIDGMILRRSVTAGTVLHPALVQHPVSIRRGERVTILGQVAGIEVRMEGQAMADGAKGELIRVRNLSSGRDVEGVVVAPGLVQVRM